MRRKELDSEGAFWGKIKREIRAVSSNNGIDIEIRKIAISNLVSHEGTIERHIRRIYEWIKEDGYQLRPIAISPLSDFLSGEKWRWKYVIHDGHHRTAALKRLGCSHVMGSIFDFHDPRIKVFRFYRTNVPVPKEKVIERATSGIKVTPRFDKHFIVIKDGGERLPFHDNSMIEPEIKTPLSRLRKLRTTKK